LLGRPAPMKNLMLEIGAYGTVRLATSSPTRPFKPPPFRRWSIHNRPISAFGCLLLRKMGLGLLEPGSTSTDHDRVACDASLISQMQEIGAHLRLAQQIGRTHVVSCQPADGLDVNVLRPRHEAGQRHVLDHTLT